MSVRRKLALVISRSSNFQLKAHLKRPFLTDLVFVKMQSGLGCVSTGEWCYKMLSNCHIFKISSVSLDSPEENGLQDLKALSLWLVAPVEDRPRGVAW